jgi:hypothetical protein
MIEVPIVDRAFPNGISMQGIMPTRMKWLWNWQPPQQWVVFTDRATDAADSALFPKANGAKKVALLLEAQHFDWVGLLTTRRLAHEFTYILTHERSIMAEFDEKALWYPHGGCWIPSHNIHLNHPKTSNLSIIASAKANCNGHKLRHTIVDKFREYMSVYGRTYNPIQCKTEGTAPFRFSFAIENGWSDDYFTEKLLDCFAVGTVPIYWGAGGISKFFNMDGVLMLPQDVSAVPDFIAELMPTLTTERYESMRHAIEDNFNRCKDYFVSEDWICEHYPFLFV